MCLKNITSLYTRVTFFLATFPAEILFPKDFLCYAAFYATHTYTHTHTYSLTHTHSHTLFTQVYKAA